MGHKPMKGFRMKVRRAGRAWRWVLQDTLDTFLDGGPASTKSEANDACHRARKDWKKKFKNMV